MNKNTQLRVNLRGDNSNADIIHAEFEKSKQQHACAKREPVKSAEYARAMHKTGNR